MPCRLSSRTTIAHISLDTKGYISSNNHHLPENYPMSVLAIGTIKFRAQID